MTSTALHTHRRPAPKPAHLHAAPSRRTAAAQPIATQAGAPAWPPYLQRRCACTGCGPCASGADTETVLQRRADGAAAATAAPALNLGAGRRLPSGVRQQVEPLFGQSFAHVRLHDGPAAARATRAVGAHAFTSGAHIAFAPGRYAPHTPGGLHLLSHELAHTVQQRGLGTPAPLQRAALTIGAAHSPHEAEADHAADRVLQGQRVGALTPVRAGTLQRAGTAAPAPESWGERAVVSVTGAAAALGNGVVEGASQAGSALLGQLSPALQALVQQGPIAWLRERMGTAVSLLMGELQRFNPLPALGQLGEVLALVMARVQAIAAGLATGQCGPLHAALADLRALGAMVADTIGERFQAVFAPVAAAFQGLWARWGAPVAEALGGVADGVWAEVQALGQFVWRDTQPLRDAGASAWAWFQTLLFGAEGEGSAGSEGGLVGWFSTQAGLAWDWAKERARPVWAPVLAVAEQAAAVLAPAGFAPVIARLQQVGTQLEGVASAVEAGAGAEAGGGGVAARRDSLATVLPGVQQLLGYARQALVGAADWVLARMGAFAGALGQFFERLQAQPVFNVVLPGLSLLQALVPRCAELARSVASGVFGLLLVVFDHVTPFVQHLLQSVRRLIGVVVDLYSLPVLLLNAAWQRLPACVRLPVQQFLTEQILARVPVFGQLLSDPALRARLYAEAVALLRQVFVDGQLARAALSLFQAAVRALGIPPELVLRLMAKAYQNMAAVLANPIGFLGNLLRSMRAGFAMFFSRIGTHLLGGVSAWLFGQMEGAGLRPPASLAPSAVFAFLIEAFGITVENVFRRLAERVGPAVTQRLRQMLKLATGVWSFVSILVTEGPAGLWRAVQERLSGLWQQVLSGLRGWLMERVIARVSRWLLSLLDATGLTPVVNAIVALYQAIESFVKYLREMLEIVSSVLDAVADMARGQVLAAAGFMERAMARSLPVVIGFLANQLGLGDLGHRIQEMLVAIRLRIDAAIDWLIERAIRMGKALLDLARRGLARLRQWWRERFAFQGADGEAHTLSFQGDGPQPEVIIQSEPQSFPQFIERFPPGDAKRQAAQALYDQLRQVQRESPPGSAQDRSADIVDLAERLAQACAALMGGGAQASTAPRYGDLEGGFGTSVTVDRLTSKHVPGNEPSLSGGRWDALNLRRNGGSSYYVLGHLLNHNLGGPGNTWANITPLTRSANSTMSAQFEEKVKEALGSKGTTAIAFEVRVTMGRPQRPKAVAELRSEDNPDEEDRQIADVIEAETWVPTRISGDAYKLGPTTSAASKSKERIGSPLDEPIAIEEKPADYKLNDSPRTPLYLSDAKAADLEAVLDDSALAARVAAAASQGEFRSKADLMARTGLKASHWKRLQKSSRYRVRLYRRT
jgi:hypothetical protein